MPLFSFPFRPFFLAAALWAVAALGAWVAVLAGVWDGPPLPPGATLAQVHAHAMLGGVLMAAVAGFFLTASTHWCARPPLTGAPLAALVGLWLAGRLAVLGGGGLPGVLVAVADLAFPVTLAGMLTYRLLRFGQPRDRVLPPIFIAFAVAQALFHAQWLGLLADGADLAVTLFAVAVAYKIAAVGGRIVPPFLDGWRRARGLAPLPPPDGRLDAACLGSIVAWGAFALTAPDGFAALAAGLIAAALNGGRWVSWQGWRTWRDPLMAVLHVGYGWLVVGLALAAVWPGHNAALHGLFAGAVGTWALALMSRASLGHTGRPLVAPWWMVPAYAAVSLGTVLRLVEAVAPSPLALPLLMASGAAWAAGFAIFAVGYGPWLLAPRVQEASA